MYCAYPQSAVLRSCGMASGPALGMPPFPRARLREPARDPREYLIKPRPPRLKVKPGQRLTRSSRRYATASSRLSTVT